MQREEQRASGRTEAPSLRADGTPRLTAHRVRPDEGSPGLIRCELCRATWNSGYDPVSLCAGVPNYRWWDRVPAHLQTKTTLGREGFKPGGPAKGCVPRGRKDEYYFLFDERDAVRKRRISSAQAEALRKGRRTAEKNSTCSRCGMRATRAVGRGRRSFPILLGRSLADPDKLLCDWCGAVERWEVRDRPEAVAWARSLVADPGGFVVFDSETTGLGSPYGDADFVEVAAVRGDGEVLICSLVRPLLEVEEGARAVHGIDDGLLRDAPGFAKIYTRLSGILEGSGTRVVVYNADFDRGVWEATRIRHGLTAPATAPLPAGGEDVRRTTPRANLWECAMGFYAAYVGEFYDEHDYRYQRLDEAGGDHSALGDARATLALIRRMAEGR